MQDEKGKQLSSVLELNLNFVLHKDEKVRLCYWLCCLFPRDSNISVEDLAIYGMCLALFEDVCSLFEARDIVHTIIDELKHEQFLVDGEEDDYGNKCVKMIYYVPDFFVPIISKYNLEITRETMIKTWPEADRFKHCIAISVELKEISECPVNLECPQLRLLKLKFRKQVSADFFEGMKQLRMLSLDIPSILPETFVVLKQLRALYVKVYKWEDMSEIGRLKHLEILSISSVSLTDIPEEMGLLSNLRLLDLRNMNIARLPQGVLSRMVNLEELYLPMSFTRWGCRPKVEHNYDDWESGEEYDFGDDGENINAGLIHIVCLPLTTLQITVPNASVLPVKSPVFKKLTKFKILVKSNLKYRPFGKGSMNELQLRGDICDIRASGVFGLLHITEDLCLTKVRNLRNVVDQLNGGDYPDLKKLIITECDDLEYVFDTMAPSFARFSSLERLHLSMLCNLKEIWHGKWPNFSWFENLKQINIRFCHQLKYVFPLSIWSKKGLIQLQSAEIHHCNEMEGIVYNDKMDNNKSQYVHFPAELHLYSLPKLVGFLVDKDCIFDGVNDDQSSVGIVSLTFNGVVFIFITFHKNREKKHVYYNFISSTGLLKKDEEKPVPMMLRNTFLQHQVQQITNVVGDHFSIEEVALSNDEHENKMDNASSSELMKKKLGSLKKLRIAFCEALKVIFSLEENHVPYEVASLLEELELYGLRSLVHIWFQIPPKKIVAFQLQVLVLSECQNLYVFSASVARLLVKLQKMHITRCEKMEEIVCIDDETTVQAVPVTKIIFPQLKVLELNYMPSLEHFYGGTSTIVFPELEILKLNQCNRMVSFSYWPPEVAMLTDIQINDGRYIGMKDLNAAMKDFGSADGQKFSETTPTPFITGR